MEGLVHRLDRAAPAYQQADPVGVFHPTRGIGAENSSYEQLVSRSNEGHLFVNIDDEWLGIRHHIMSVRVDFDGVALGWKILRYTSDDVLDKDVSG